MYLDLSWLCPSPTHGAHAPKRPSNQWPRPRPNGGSRMAVHHLKESRLKRGTAVLIVSTIPRPNQNAPQRPSESPSIHRSSGSLVQVGGATSPPKEIHPATSRPTGPKPIGVFEVPADAPKPHNPCGTSDGTDQVARRLSEGTHQPFSDGVQQPKDRSASTEPHSDPVARINPKPKRTDHTQRRRNARIAPQMDAPNRLSPM